MADAFDPYHVWLGIPPEEQPPNRYRLLAIKLFEDNPDVIDGAADRQAAHLRTFQSGQNSKLSQRLLNEVAAARYCLLNPESKAAYDQQLRAALTPAPPVSANSAIGRGAVPPPQAPPSGSAIGRAMPTPGGSAIGRAAPAPGGSQIRRNAPENLPTAQRLPTAAPIEQPAPAAQSTAEANWDALMGSSVSKTLPSSGKKRYPVRRKSSNAPKLIGIGVALVACIAAGVAFVAMRGPGDATLTFDWPAADRAAATLAVDGQPVTIPASGAWDFHCPPGAHHIVAGRRAFKSESTVTLAAGDQQPIDVEWKPKAELALTWPVAERTGAALMIDGHAQAVSQQQPLKLPIEPGRHVVRVTRPNAEPFEQTVTVAPDDLHIVTIFTPALPTLVLDWPAAERADARLRIDDAPQAIDLNAAKLEFHPKAGDHIIRLARRGFLPIQQHVTLEAGKTTPFAPAWTAVAETIDPATHKPPAGNPLVDNGSGSTDKPSPDPLPFNAPPAVKRLAVPSAADQAASQKSIRETFRSDFAKKSPSDQLDLAKKLFDDALETKDSPADRFTLLAESRDLSARAGSLESTMRAIGELATEFEFDPVEMKSAAFPDLVKSATTPFANTALAEAVHQAMDEAVEADEYPAAQKLLPLFKSAAAKSKDKQLIARAARAEKELTDLRKQYDEVRSAEEVLKKTPNDPAANLTVGQFECFWKDDWDAGLPKLAKSGDANLQEAAKKDLANPDDATEQVHVGDAWWKVAEAEAEPLQGRIKQRAAGWYRRALPDLSGLAKAKVESRLDGLSAATTPVTIASGRGHRVVDLLKLAEERTGAVRGVWKLTRDGLSCDPSESAWFEFPYQPPDEYDFSMEFTRQSGMDDVQQRCVAAGHSFNWTMSAYRQGLAGINIVGGQGVDVNSTRRNFEISNGRRYTTVIKVRRRHVEAWINGKLIEDFATDYQNMSVGPNDRLRHDATLGVGSHESATVFHSVRVTEVTGTGKRLADSRSAAKEPKLSGVCTLRSKHEGVFLAVDGGGTNQGTGAIAWGNPGNDQFWIIEPLPGGSFRLLNKNSGLVLGIRQDLKDAGIDAILWGWGGTDGQQWLIEPLAGGYAKIINKNSNLCLSVREADGRLIVQEPWHNRDTQLWKLTPADK